MNKVHFLIVLALAGVLILGSAIAAVGAPTAVLLVTGLGGASGSTIGPGGALYVTENFAGRISRIDPKSGAVTIFASGLPISPIGLGGAMDVAFIGSTAYALVTVVGPDVGGSDIVGIYRVDGPSSFTVIADLGAFSMQNLPDYPVDLPTGVQYALQAYRGGFLVTDGHHNRVLWVTLDGAVSELIAFGNTVPTGLAFMAIRSTWPKPGLSPTLHRMARSSPSSRDRPPPPRLLPAPACSLTLNLAVVAACTPSRKATFHPGAFRVPQPPRTPALSWKSKVMAASLPS
jgi:hypothetical protein